MRDADFSSVRRNHIAVQAMRTVPDVPRETLADFLARGGRIACLPAQDVPHGKQGRASPHARVEPYWGNGCWASTNGGKP